MEITGYRRDEGMLEPTTITIIDGVPHTGGYPLERTDTTETLHGWNFSEARVWLTDGGVEVYLPDTDLNYPYGVALHEGRIVRVGLPANRGMMVSTRHTSDGRISESLLVPCNEKGDRL